MYGWPKKGARRFATFRNGGDKLLLSRLFQEEAEGGREGRSVRVIHRKTGER